VHYFTVGELRDVNFRAWVAEFYGKTPKLLGTTRSMPTLGSTYVSATTNDQHVLMWDGVKYSCYINSCAHLGLQFVPVGKTFRGEVVSRQGKQRDPRFITCGWHARRHNSETGELIGAGASPCRKLRKIEIVRRGDLIFEAADGSLPGFEGLIGSPKFKQLGIKPLEIPTNYVLVKTIISPEKFDAITGAANFPEDAHVGPAHPTTYGYLYDMQTLEVEAYEPEWSAQFVGWQMTETAKPSRGCGKLRELILKRTGGKPPVFGVIWYQFGLFDTMERFSIDTDVANQVIIVSSFLPNKSGIGSRNVIEFYFPEHVASDSEFVETFLAAYDEPGAEDRDLCLAAEDGYDARIDAGYGTDPVIAADATNELCLLNYYQYLRSVVKKSRLEYS
jgi:nitrite reductase/ring-hydroxylating ferredoxin subunit